ncbi:hypothetical protein [Bacillus sp. 165]|uniref:hypothetical protein n=1 Tax=Bacillus sp. 165 TaxID=1529117 RepID=UPI001ADB9A10|nr:hypothetical protein [Bacillus sp. 165]MBO9128641.1 hypothetical protein [Bacillus sp. 165]
MNGYKLLISIILIAVSFILYILSLLEVFPLLLAVPLLFFTTFITVIMFNNHKRFKGFRS